MNVSVVTTLPQAPLVASPDPAGPPAQPTWEAKELKPLVLQIFKEDKRFIGLSRYIVNVRIFWSFDIPTACAGHGFIFFNPDFWDSIPEQTRRTVLAHEVWHLILKHLDRGEGCDPTIHNQAADHVINLNLEKDGFTFDGTTPFKDPIYLGKSTEQVYNAIWEERMENPPVPVPGGATKEQIETLIKDILGQDGKGKSLQDQKDEAEADVDAAGLPPGYSPGNTGIKLEMSGKLVKILNKTYAEIFKDYMTDPLTGGGRSYFRPNRRTHGSKSPLILPGRSPKKGAKNRLTHLVYALDVSGSITLQQAQQFHDSVRTLKEMLNPEKLTVLLFDTRIVFEKTFTDREKYGNIAVHAGGGTDLKDVYKRMSALGAEAMVIFTDLCVGIPPEPPWETIWIVPSMTCNIPAGLYGNVYLIPKI
jgi:predicted metal-dependent peptidase